MKYIVSIVAVLSLVLMSACAGGYEPPGGSIYTGVKLSKGVPTAGAVTDSI